MPLIPALRRQRQEDLWVFEVSLVDKASSRIVKAEERNPVLNKTKQTNKKCELCF